MVGCGEADRQVSGNRRKEMKAEVHVIGLPGNRLGEAAGLFARCFLATPEFVELPPSERACSRTLPRMFAASLRDGVDLSHV
jgi:hypothetical protein